MSARRILSNINVRDVLSSARRQRVLKDLFEAPNLFRGEHQLGFVPIRLPPLELALRQQRAGAQKYEQSDERDASCPMGERHGQHFDYAACADDVYCL